MAQNKTAAQHRRRTAKNVELERLTSAAHSRLAVSQQPGMDTENMTPVIVCYLQGTNIHFAFDDWCPLEVSNFAEL